jgi:hypothetical protein
LHEQLFQGNKNQLLKATSETPPQKGKQAKTATITPLTV